MHKEMIAALRASTYHFFMNGEKISFMITEDKDIVVQVCIIEAMVRELISKNDIVFTKKRLKISRHEVINYSDLGKKFLHCLKFDRARIKEFYPMHEFSPNFEKFFSAQENHEKNFPRILGGYFADQVDDYIKSLNESVEFIRLETKKDEFKYKKASFNRLPNENFLGLNKYIDNLLKKYHHLLVLRIDFGYKKRDQFLQSDFFEIDYSEVSEHRLMLMRYIKEKLPEKSIEGFAWKLQHSLNTSYQYSFMLFSKLDAIDEGESEKIVKLIGTYWNEKITGGRGFYYDGKNFPSGFKRFGIGINNYGDEVARAELKKAAFYLTKRDDYLRLLVPENGRSFSKGQLL